MVATMQLFKYSFNPRICKRCDTNVILYSYITRVSIHASVKDATIGFFRCFTFTVVSIHASVKDATRFDVNVRYDALFQSTHL